MEIIEDYAKSYNHKVCAKVTVRLKLIFTIKLAYVIFVSWCFKEETFDVMTDLHNLSKHWNFKDRFIRCTFSNISRLFEF